jgi:serine/threonine protein kinase
MIESLSHYRILSRLGAGGMGEVYLAEDSRLNRRVAIKFLPPQSVSDESAKKRLIREAQAAAILDHPNICATYEVGEDDGRSFIVMQYVEGETLADLIQRGPVTQSDLLDISIQAADALSEAHSRGIIHRDIKPANIMVTARRQVKGDGFRSGENCFYTGRNRERGRKTKPVDSTWDDSWDRTLYVSGTNPRKNSECRE